MGDRWVGRWRPLFAGLLFNINPKLNFAVASCSGLVFFVLLARLRVSSAPQAMQEAISGGKATLEDALRLLTLPRFWRWSFVVGTCIYGVYDQQFLVYFFLAVRHPAGRGTRCTAT